MATNSPQKRTTFSPYKKTRQKTVSLLVPHHPLTSTNQFPKRPLLNLPHEFLSPHKPYYYNQFLNTQTLLVLRLQLLFLLLLRLLQPPTTTTSVSKSTTNSSYHTNPKALTTLSVQHAHKHTHTHPFLVVQPQQNKNPDRPKTNPSSLPQR
jgi:hypothetical protein